MKIYRKLYIRTYLHIFVLCICFNEMDTIPLCFHNYSLASFHTMSLLPI